MLSVLKVHTPATAFEYIAASTAAAAAAAAAVKPTCCYCMPDATHDSACMQASIISGLLLTMAGVLRAQDQRCTACYTDGCSNDYSWYIDESVTNGCICSCCGRCTPNDGYSPPKYCDTWGLSGTQDVCGGVCSSHCSNTYDCTTCSGSGAACPSGTYCCDDSTYASDDCCTSICSVRVALLQTCLTSKHTFGKGLTPS